MKVGRFGAGLVDVPTYILSWRFVELTTWPEQVTRTKRRIRSGSDFRMVAGL